MVKAAEKSELLNAQELSMLFRISVPTLYRIFREGPPKRAKKGGRQCDLRKIPNRYVGGRRYWSRTAAEKLMAQIGGR